MTEHSPTRGASAAPRSAALRVVLAVLFAITVPFWIWQATRMDEPIARVLFVILIVVNAVGAVSQVVVAISIKREQRVRESREAADLDAI